MHCADLAAAGKAAVLTLVGEHGGKAMSVYNEGRLYEWRDLQGRSYTAYVAETPAGELVENH